MRGDDQLGEVVVQGPDESGMMRSQRLPTYTCGHCSQVVIMRPDRQRERVRCSVCGRLLCEQNELCRADCTPIHALAKDRFEADPRWTRLLPAILAGCSTEEEARRRGFDV